uniref:Uncharacterized protein n=1 Tax=Phaeocystis antarctica TaxID=33657 RepID=A0A7S0EKE1_9EUKA
MARTSLAVARSLCTKIRPLSDEWARVGLGANRAAPHEKLNRLLFVQCGFGCDQHGDRKKGSTAAALRAVRDAISFNSIPGVALSVPGGRDNMLVHVKLGVPSQFSEVDLDEVARVFPYGKLLPIEVTTGGLTFGCGRVVTELGDEDDTAIVAVAAVSLGYHDPSDAALSPRTWDTRDGH